MLRISEENLVKYAVGVKSATYFAVLLILPCGDNATSVHSAWLGMN